MALSGSSRARRKRFGFVASAAILAGAICSIGPSDALLRPVVAKTAMPANLPAAPKDGELGFVLSAFAPAHVPGMKENCPDGYANTISENYLTMLSPAERARLSKKENEKELDRLWKAHAIGPNTTNLCSNYNLWPEEPLQKTVQSKVALGLDLDGDDGTSAKSGACRHASFRSPAGEAGIDNQGYRAMGCLRGWRSPDGGPGDVHTYFNNQLKTGEFNIVLLLRGVDSLVQDDDVQVTLASSLDQPAVDPQQNVIRGMSFGMMQNPRLRSTMRGKIRNGVLTTEPHEIAISQPIYDGERGPRMARFEWLFHEGRLRANIQPDGSLSGLIGGYLPLISLFNRGASSGLGSTHTVNYDCASSYNTLKKLADGGRDPRTGQCTTISTAFEIKAVPAFVTDRPSNATASK